MGGLFEDMLKSGESLFKNEAALDFNFQPKLIPYREPEQRHIAQCIKPLLTLERSGKNIFIYGKPGIGKTAALRHILTELEEQTNDIYAFYLNCWQKNTTYKIMLDLCDALNYKFTQNRKTEELFAVVKQLINRKSAVFVFDETDKLQDVDFLYMISEEILKKSIILITNYASFLTNLDQRIRSRLLPESLEFRTYNAFETKGILKQRLEYAFYPGIWADDAFEFIVGKSTSMQDIRTGLHLMREAATIAENKSSRKVLQTHALEAAQKLTDFTVKEVAELSPDEQQILEVVEKNSGQKIGDIYKTYLETGNEMVYKSFQRKVEKLAQNNFITTKRLPGGKDGNTTLVFKNAEKKLSEF